MAFLFKSQKTSKDFQTRFNLLFFPSCLPILWKCFSQWPKAKRGRMWPVKFSPPLGSCFPIHPLLPGHTFCCYRSLSVPTLTGLTSGLTPSWPLDPLWDVPSPFVSWVYLVRGWMLAVLPAYFPLSSCLFQARICQQQSQDRHSKIVEGSPRTSDRLPKTPPLMFGILPSCYLFDVGQMLGILHRIIQSNNW